MTEKMQTPTTQQAVEIDEADLETLNAGIVDPANPNVVFVGGRRYVTADPDQPIVLGRVYNPAG